MSIAITGTPGTGKTTISKRLAEELDFDYISVNDMARERGFIIDKDEERDAEVVDTFELKDIEMEGDKVLDGHLSHYIPVDITIVLRCRPDILKKRMQDKGWKEEKVQENLEAEIIGVISSEAKGEGNEVYEVGNMERTPDETVNMVIEIIREREGSEKFDWLEDYHYMLGR